MSTAYPDLDEGVSRAVLAQLDDADVLGLLVTLTLLPEPKGLSLEELTEIKP